MQEIERREAVPDRVEGSSKPRDAGREDKGDELIARGRIAQGLRARLVVAYRGEDVAER